jgi:pimeloyl-ACP methyl ester carboxylesterase
VLPRDRGQEVGVSKEDVLPAFAARGAGDMEHPGGTLLEHLARTGERLRSWGAPAELVRAGLAHAAYGTDGYAPALFGWDERETVAALVGTEAEAIVHRYARCDRAFTFARLGIERCVRDRVDGSVVALDDRAVRALAQLTVANELDVLAHSPSFRERHADGLRRLFRSWRPLLCDAAVDDCRRVLGDEPGTDPTHLDLLADGVRLHALRFGLPERPSVVFAHGGGLNAYAWEPICVGLAPTHHCVSLDLRGHGDSEWPPSPDYSVDAHACDLHHAIEALGLELPVVVGHSLGGFAALRYAEAHANELAGVVVVDTNPFVTGDEPAVAKIRAFARGPAIFDTFDDALARARSFSHKDDERLRNSLRRSLRQLSDGRWTWKRDQRGLEDRHFDAVIHDAHQLVPRLSAVTCPTLVVRGEHGMSAPDTSRLCAALPAATSVTIANAGHNVHRDNPAHLLDAISRFLSDSSEIGRLDL